MAGSYGRCTFNCLTNCQTVPQSSCITVHYQQYRRVLVTAKLCNVGLVSLSNVRYFQYLWWHFAMVLIYISPMNNDLFHEFTSSLTKGLFKYLPIFSSHQVQRALYTLCMHVLCQICNLQIFFQFVAIPFIFLSVF